MPTHPFPHLPLCPPCLITLPPGLPRPTRPLLSPHSPVSPTSPSPDPRHRSSQRLSTPPWMTARPLTISQLRPFSVSGTSSILILLVSRFESGRSVIISRSRMYRPSLYFWSASYAKSWSSAFHIPFIPCHPIAIPTSEGRGGKRR